MACYACDAAVSVNNVDLLKKFGGSKKLFLTRLQPHSAYARGGELRAMPRDDFLISLNEREFIVKALQEEELRVDGRGPFDTRPVSYRFGPKDGMCEVRLGDTRVLAVVSAKLEQPSGARSNEGSISINVEFSPMASPNFEPGRPGEEAQELASVLERAIRETGAVDVESLCVLAGRRVWHVRCDVHVMDACGNIAGAASLAANAAMLSFRRPEATVSPDTQLITVHPADVREPVPLALHHLPVAVTFGFFAEQDGLVIADPTVNEEMVVGSDLVVVLNAHDELCAVQYGGECAVNPAELPRCVRIASRISKDLTQDLKKAHAAWEEERDKRRVRRHYGAEAAANPDFGLPGRGDHLKPAQERDQEEKKSPEEEEEDDEGDVSNSDEDHEDEEAGDEEMEDDSHVPLGVLAPNLSEEDEEEEEEEEKPSKKKNSRSEATPKAKGKAAADLEDDDIFGMFDAAAKKEGKGSGGAGAKKKGRWDDLPGDGDSLTAAIRTKVAKKQRKKKK